MQSASWLSEVPQRLSVSTDQVTVTNMLLATDFSECSARALDFALGIASRYESQLHLFHCIDPTPYRLADPDVVWKTRDDAQSELEGLVSRLRDQSRAKNLEVKVMVEVGDLSEILPQAVKDLDLDLIVVGTHGRTGWSKLVLGSVAELAIDQVFCPVLSVGPSSSRTRIQQFGPGNILLVSEASTRSQLAEKYAFSLARKYGSRLTVVDVLENRSGRVVAEVSQIECCQTELSDSSPNRALTSLSQLPSEIGTQSDLILQVADRTAADLVVLAVPESHRFTERFVSTNSYRVVCGAPCPVLTVRTR
ncbi:MAG TPA: universal stress protein [Terriglobales bacterium]|jgi:universal stress protein A|nr:universal stress protein [Terriglobales bacterium]